MKKLGLIPKYIDIYEMTVEVSPYQVAGFYDSQTKKVYLPDDLTARLFTTEAPYTKRGPSPYTNLNDRIIHDSGGADGGFLRMSREGDRHVGTATLGVAV